MEPLGGKVEVMCSDCHCVFHITGGVNPVYNKCPKCGGDSYSTSPEE